jgi:uncharacterized protein YjbI with pentapeptide repeats
VAYGLIRARMFRIAASLGIVVAACAFSAPPAQAATCPTVDPSTGAVSPAPAAGVQWAGCDLSGANLAGADFVRADLTGASLGHAILTAADLDLANLTNATFAGANLTSASIGDATVTGAGLSGATLSGASGIGIIGSPASLPAHWNIRGGFLIGPGSGTLLTDADLDNLNLTSVDFSGLNLLRATFRHADLTSADLTRANLTGADFSSANLTKANLTGATVSSTVFASTTWSHTTCPDGTISDNHSGKQCFAPAPSSGFTAKQLPLPAGGRTNTFSPAAISCSSATQCFGGGSYLDSTIRRLPALLRWNGKQWSASQAPQPTGASTHANSAATVSSMACPSATRCMAGGKYQNSTGNQAMLLSWSGKNWTATKAPLPAGASPNPDADVAGMACRSASMCFAVGEYGDTAANLHGLILRWSSGKWSAMAAPLPAGSRNFEFLAAVSCPSLTLCFAGGQHRDAFSQSQVVLLRWSGGTWASVKVPLPTGAAADPQAMISGLSCPTTTQCVAVGTYTDSRGLQQGLLLTRSGTKWTAAKAPLPVGAASNPFASLNAVSCPAASRCTAAGGFTNTAAQSVGLLLFWSGKAWKAAAAPATAYRLTGISCPATSHCVAVSAGIGHPVGLTGP